MNPKRSQVMVVLTLLAVSTSYSMLFPVLAAAFDSSPPKPAFLVFDATNYINKPLLRQYGIRPLPAINEFFRKGEDRSVVPSNFRISELATQAKRSGSDICYIGIEHWPTKESAGDWSEGQRKYLDLLRKFKQQVPGIKVGYYSQPPAPDYWRTIKDASTPEYREWQRDNDRLTPLAKEVDVLYPSLYAFYNDTRGWVRYATAQILEARRYPGGKPVYPFLWPQYHDSNKLLGEQFIDRDFWRLQLDTVRKYADGVVIWGGWDSQAWKPRRWDESAPWWTETQAFLRGQPAK
jgi:hypothetical protein